MVLREWFSPSGFSFGNIFSTNFRQSQGWEIYADGDERFVFIDGSNNFCVKVKLEASTGIARGYQKIAIECDSTTSLEYDSFLLRHTDKQ